VKPPRLTPTWLAGLGAFAGLIGTTTSNAPTLALAGILSLSSIVYRCHLNDKRIDALIARQRRDAAERERLARLRWNAIDVLEYRELTPSSGTRFSSGTPSSTEGA
jgi:hypothetical protein